MRAVQAPMVDKAMQARVRLICQILYICEMRSECKPNEDCGRRDWTRKEVDALVMSATDLLKHLAISTVAATQHRSTNRTHDSDIRRPTSSLANRSTSTLCIIVPAKSTTRQNIEVLPGHYHGFARAPCSACLPGAGRVALRIHRPPPVSEALQPPKTPNHRCKGWLVTGFPFKTCSVARYVRLKNLIFYTHPATTCNYLHLPQILDLTN
ncbi:hypothetical protein QBC45DRAFT_184575 [Copromyces sp. CBS 386.78]|nr:hypothetical protein QBC45DRAFT_184575 [Copromyces sp. CBS 386.78]